MNPVGVGTIVVGVICLAVLLVRVRTDPARLGNAGWLVATGVLLWFGTAIALAPLLPEIAVPMIAGIIWGSLASVTIVPVAAIVNGLVVLRREGPGIPAALPLVAGLVCLVAAWYVWAFGLDYTGGTPTILSILTLSVLAVSAYVGVLFVGYAGYAALYLRIPVPTDIAATVTLGAALTDDRVTPLLAGRLDKAIGVRGNASGSDRVLMVVSGGRGSDEPVAEADAMARYLHDRGIDDRDIRREDRSTTTRENLLFSRAVLAAEGPLSGDVVVVTNNFHALRAASFARELGLPWRVVGSPTARYYLPTAFLREFAAIVVRHWRIHLPVVVILVLLPLMPLLIPLVPPPIG